MMCIITHLILLHIVLIMIGCGRSLAALLNTTTFPVVEIPVGKAQVDRDSWLQFLSENLEPDIAYWRKREPLAAADVLKAYDMLLKIMNVPAVIQLALVYNNKLYWPNRPDPNGGDPTRHWASYFNIQFHRRLTAALASGRLKLPNVIFIYNTDDNAPRFNAPHRSLGVPILSLIKSVGLHGGDDLDILVPQMFMIQSSMYSVPWHLKIDRAFFRGIGFCSGRWVQRYWYIDACPRLYLSHLTQRDLTAGNGSALDCGLVEKYLYTTTHPNASVRYELPVYERVPFSQHAYYKWLLHLEGITASSRLGQLFNTNSLVLLQRSPWIEYFYRSLRPWQHYVPFWNASAPDGTPLGMDDVYGTLAEVRRMDREHPEELQRIVAAANAFAVKFLNSHSRLLYYEEAINRYRSLFRDMEQFVEVYVSGLRAQGWRIT